MGKTPPIKVLVVEDHILTRAGLALVLASFTDLVLYGEVSSGEDALAFIRESRPDVVLMDLRLPGMDGVQTTAEIACRHPQVKVIILTSYPDVNLFERAMKAGALSYLLKDVTANDLAGAIRSARAGVPVISQAATELLARSVVLGERQANNLTRCEQEVLQLMAGGLSNAQIALRMDIDPAAVAQHSSSLMAKLGADNRSNAVEVAWQQQLLE